MNSRSCLLLAGMALALFLPSARVCSQMAPVARDPIAALQALQKANDDLLKRQEASLKELTDLTTTAREARIFTRRS